MTDRVNGVAGVGSRSAPATPRHPRPASAAHRRRPRTGREPRRIEERGAVTAEAAMVIPMLAGLTLVLVWMVAVAAAQVRLVDAARETARAIARDDGLAAARTQGLAVAPRGARVVVSRSGPLVRVVLTADVPGPDRFLRLAGVTLRAEAVTASEELP